MCRRISLPGLSDEGSFWLRKKAMKYLRAIKNKKMSRSYLIVNRGEYGKGHNHFSRRKKQMKNVLICWIWLNEESEPRQWFPLCHLSDQISGKTIFERIANLLNIALEQVTNSMFVAIDEHLKNWDYFLERF